MLRMVLTAMSVLVVMGPAVPAMAGECKGCDRIAHGSDGFCCSKGSAFGVTLTSRKLYDALKGKEISEKDAENCPCSGCKKAVQINGTCDVCKYVGGRLYSSPVSYTLAKGAPMSAELLASCPKSCKECKSAFKKNERCLSCDVGFVAGRMFANRESYEAALAAFTTLQKAAKTANSCENCAVAMVTDGRCEKCKVQFKGGKIASKKS